MEGFLEKQSSENPQLWKGRWFVMKDDKLFYYKREADVREKKPSDPTVCGVIQLADIDSVTTAVRCLFLWMEYSLFYLFVHKAG